MQQLAREFRDLRQTTETVVEITTKFSKKALLVMQYAADIREFVSKILNDMI